MQKGAKKPVFRLADIVLVSACLGAVGLLHIVSRTVAKPQVYQDLDKLHADPALQSHGQTIRSSLDGTPYIIRVIETSDGQKCLFADKENPERRDRILWSCVNKKPSP